MSDNADIVTNAATALERYRREERDLELELTQTQIRLEMVRRFISDLSGERKRYTRKQWRDVTSPEPEPAA